MNLTWFFGDEDWGLAELRGVEFLYKQSWFLWTFILWWTCLLFASIFLVNHQMEVITKNIPAVVSGWTASLSWTCLVGPGNWAFGIGIKISSDQNFLWFFVVLSNIWDYFPTQVFFWGVMRESHYGRILINQSLRALRFLPRPTGGNVQPQRWRVLNCWVLSGQIIATENTSFGPPKDS